MHILAFATLALIASLAWLAFQRETMPSVVSGTSVSPLRESPPVAASPIAIAFSVTVVIVTETPIPATNTPESHYTPLPEPSPIDVCLASTPRGEVCEQPEPPIPTSTPILPCPVDVGEVCVGQGEPLRWLTPTPTEEPE